MSSRIASSVKQVPEHLGLHRETLSQTTTVLDFIHLCVWRGGVHTIVIHGEARAQLVGVGSPREVSRFGDKSPYLWCHLVGPYLVQGS